MNLPKIISELRSELADVERAIESLERLTAAGPRKRGRPPKWRSQAGGAAAPAKTLKARAAAGDNWPDGSGSD